MVMSELFKYQPAFPCGWLHLDVTEALTTDDQALLQMGNGGCRFDDSS